MAASYGSFNPPETSPSSQLRPTILQSKEDRVTTWKKKTGVCKGRNIKSFWRCEGLQP